MKRSMRSPRSFRKEHDMTRSIHRFFALLAATPRLSGKELGFPSVGHPNTMMINTSP